MDLHRARENVKLALQASADWRRVAREDYRFYQGAQYDQADLDALKKSGKPAMTINRCRAMVNLVSGHATLNAYEPDFLPRGQGDDDICRAAKGVTKYVYERAAFKREKKKVFRDKLICGRGYFWVYYDFDYDRMDGVIKIERKSPFAVFVDPESVNEDLSDAEFCGLFSWESPAELAQIYSEHKDAIMAMSHQYDQAEKAALETVAGEPLWYSKQFKKLRVVQYWYKVYGTKLVYEYAPGKIIGEDDLAQTPELIDQIAMMGIQGFRLPSCQIKMMTFVGDVVLEAKESPYKHKRLPLVQEVAFYTGERGEDAQGLEPAGIIRDIKDPQREINKQRSQRMHIVITQANGIWLVHGQLTPDLKRKLETMATKPGGIIDVPQGVTVERITPDGVATANVELERMSSDDLYNITGINPELLGIDIAPGASGRAIELKQKQAVTQIADLFDEQQHAERQVLDRLWGDKGRPGLIPQYFTDEMVVRIIGDDGQADFVNLRPGLGQAMAAEPVMDPMTGQPVVNDDGRIAHRVLYDLSKFEFDIVINDSPATPTARLSNLYQLQDAIKSGVPAEAVLDILIDLMDFPGKQDAKQRVAMYMQAKMQQMMPPPPPGGAPPGVPPERAMQPPNPGMVPPM